MTKAISVSALTKKYGEIEAVRGIDFAVAAGETFGFLGPNAALGTPYRSAWKRRFCSPVR